MKSSRRGAPGADNKSLEYLIFEFYSQIEQGRFFSVAAIAIFKSGAISGCQVLLQKTL